MVETLEKSSLKRRKLDQAFSGLTNINYTAEILNEPEEPRLGGTQVIIQFKDDKDELVGVQISVDSLSSKGDLNKMLAEFLKDKEEDHTGPQLYQFFLGDREIKTDIQDSLDK